MIQQVSAPQRLGLSSDDLKQLERTEQLNQAALLEPWSWLLAVFLDLSPLYWNWIPKTLMSDDWARMTGTAGLAGPLTSSSYFQVAHLGFLTAWWS